VQKRAGKVGDKAGMMILIIGTWRKSFWQKHLLVDRTLVKPVFLQHSILARTPHYPPGVSPNFVFPLGKGRNLVLIFVSRVPMPGEVEGKLARSDFMGDI